MKVFENYNLKNDNTFHLNVIAKKVIVIEKEEELIQLKDILNNSRFLILGGGSNVLFLNEYFDGVIIKNEMKGKEIIHQTEEEILLKINSGENWHNIVMWSVENNWNGIENLALIPGTVGAAPVQNIGAYGVEIKDVLESVRFFNVETQQFQILNNNECLFSYRNSIFKNELKDKVFITNITIRLRKQNHIYRLDYGNIKDELNKMNIKELSPKIIAQAVINIRQSKLPNPNEIGNAGSFFKNPEVDETKFSELKKRFPDIVAFPTADGKYKLAAGWMIEKCGLKGYVHKGAAVHHKQALVLINQNNATGQDIFELAQIIIRKIFDTFAVTLEPEVNIIQ